MSQFFLLDYIHLIFTVRPCLNLTCLASGVIHFQLFLAVQNRSFCCLILEMGVSYHTMLIYYLNYERTGL